ncbi:MAG: WavE lipopolysaccharide synthesis family protein, partial [bacterium]|nr:WavE lipopolysaccharide synthesis family protein [bacterium]
MIEAKDISVVIQGAISSDTKKVVDSIKKFLPEAEIIISTWKGSNVKNLEYDKIIFNKDIGAIPFRLNGQKHNLNRQIISTFSGVKKASRKYVLKLRSDIILLNKNFLKYFDMFPCRDSKYKIFKNRIIITNVYTRNSSPQMKCLFHPSDWVMFGLKEDIFKMWNIPLAKEPETSQWFTTHKKPDNDIFPDFLTRYHAEQYIWINVLKKNGVNFKFNNYMSYSKKLVQISDRSIFNNFIILDYKP